MEAIKSMFRQKSIGRLNEARPGESNVLFSTGLGINVKPEIPIRLAAYLLPLITLTSEYPGTRGQFYLADKAALRIGQDPSVVQSNSQLMRAFVSSFVDFYAPSARDSILISSEKSDGESVTERRAALVKELVGILIDTRDRAIINFASNRLKDGQNIQVPLGYMAEHALFMRDAVTEDNSLFLIDNPDGYALDTLAMIGGPAEEIFYKARIEILRSLESRGRLSNGFKRIQLFSEIGRIPPYYSRFGEPTVESGMPYECAKALLTALNPEIRKDYLVLLISLSEDRDFSMLDRKNDLSDEDYASLQSGLSKLIYFLTQFRNEQESILAGRQSNPSD